MRLNDLQPAEGSRHAAKRVGRGIGSGLGKTAGRGHKGQTSRSGGSIKAGFEGGQMPLQRRLPKRGFTSRVGLTTSEIRLGELAKIESTTIDLMALKNAGLVTKKTLRARVFLSGSIDRAVTIEGLMVSKGAKAAIEAAGGTVTDAE